MKIYIIVLVCLNIVGIYLLYKSVKDGNKAQRKYKQLKDKL